MVERNPRHGKFIAFKLARHWVALPAVAVLRIVNCPPPEQGGTIDFGVVQLGPHTIRLLDLRSRWKLQPEAVPEKLPFLLVMRGPQQTLWGIALETPPDLLELPLSTFKSVPLEKRMNRKLQWISHMTVITERDIHRTLLLLDLKAVFQSKVSEHTTKRPRQNQSHASSTQPVRQN
ncbi:MAG: chemotaxis protein CheW [Leptolyngbyaceae cyanobacterium]|mgnify:CR=1 FL=1